MVAHNEKGANNWRALEWLRSMADECGINIAVIGDLCLLGMEAALPQLWGRVATNRPVIIRETAKADVEAIAASFRIREATSLQVLRSVSKRGALRQVANVCRHSWVISGGQSRNTRPTHPCRCADLSPHRGPLQLFQHLAGLAFAMPAPIKPAPTEKDCPR
jgi:hypothetical protein